MKKASSPSGANIEASLSAVSARVGALSDRLLEMQHQIGCSQDDLRRIQWDLEDIYISLQDTPQSPFNDES